MRFASIVLSGLALTGISSALPTATNGDIASPVKRQTATPSLGLSVYWGQPGIQVASLTSICTDSAFTHVNLAFITNLFGPGGYPILNLDRRGASYNQSQAAATGLVDGTGLMEAIGKCQASGKKVLLSIGGSTGVTTFTAARYAEAAATNIFNLFLGGSNATVANIRPFGTRILDGVDLDPENKKPAYWKEFVQALRKKMNADTKKKYVITAAPQCPRNYPADQPLGDKSLPDAVLKLVDHVWVQFYNNDANGCNHGQTGFTQSLKTWSTAVSPAKVWVGGLSKADAGGSGYITSAAMATEIANVKKLKLSNFGGYMLWNAEKSKQNANYHTPIRTALNKP